VIATVGRATGRSRAKGLRYTLSGPEAIRRDVAAEFPLPTAKEDEVRVPVASPDGDSLVWLVEHDGARAFTFYVSRIDGSEPREVARYDALDEATPRLLAHNVRWSPDGRRISFLADGIVYTARAFE
jgi:hypothetical protein